MYCLARCECNSIKEVDLRNIIKGVSKKCRSCSSKDAYRENEKFKDINTGKIRRVDEIGNRYDKLVVIEFHKISKTSKNAIWKCQCDCGRISYVNSTALRKGRVRQCKNCSSRKYAGKLSGSHYGRIRYYANKRDKTFEVTQEFLWDLFVKQEAICSLTGLKLEFGDTIQEQNQGNTTASLDRINSDLGYVVDNIQWVHKIVNVMKQDLSEEEFINYCKLVVDYDNKKKQLAVANSIDEDEWIKWL